MLHFLEAVIYLVLSTLSYIMPRYSVSLSIIPATPQISSILEKMSVHGDLVGRLAQLRNIASKPELNEAFVLIQAYLQEKDRFAVRTLSAPNSKGNAVNIAVKLNSLVLCTGDYFADKHPIRHEVRIESLENVDRGQPEGTTLKLTSTDHFKMNARSVVLQKSYRCVGDKTELANSGIPEPVTTCFGNLHIAPTSEDAILEFEDIHFIGSKPSTYDILTCTSGHFTTFRRCVFSNVQIIVAGNDSITTFQLSPAYAAQRVSHRLGTPNVVFENCVIDAGILKVESTGICAGNDGTVTLLNCVIRNCGVGFATTAGSRIVMKHCVVENCMSGVGVGEKTKSVDMLNCFVSKNLDTPWFGGYGILVDQVAQAVIDGCRVENGQDFGLYLRGKYKHVNRVTVNDSFVSGCDSGVCIDLGEFAVSISRTCLQNNSRHGIIIYPTAVGSVAVAQCSIVENRIMDVLNGSPAEGMLTVDGVGQEAVRSAYTVLAQLAAQRCGQRAGICDIHCLNCGRKEEAGEKFKKCGKCEDVCYCSRECQKAHWKEHKRACEPQGTAAATAIRNEIDRYQKGLSSMDELREVVQLCDPRRK